MIGKKTKSDVPVFAVVLLLPNPPKLEVGLLWPKPPPPPNPNDMVGDVDYYGLSGGEMGDEVEWEKSARHWRPTRENRVAVRYFLENGKGNENLTENSRRSTGCATGVCAGQHRVVSPWKKIAGAMEGEVGSSRKLNW